MVTTGRNDPCFCGSGKKFKKCCLEQSQGKELIQQAPGPQERPLTRAVEMIRQAGLARVQAINILGVFVLFATKAGDAWLLEITEMDGLQVAAAGEALDIEIEENPETIAINYSHKFKCKDKTFSACPYNQKQWQSFPEYPGHAIDTAIKKAMAKFPSQFLGKVHVP